MLVLTGFMTALPPPVNDNPQCVSPWGLLESTGLDIGTGPSDTF